MKLLGIEFIPLSEPLERRLETLAAGAWFWITTFLGYTFLFFFIYLLWTRYWWLPIIYYSWVYYDRDICEKGGRSIKWVQNWSWWRYTKNYYTPKLVLVPNINLDTKRNYLFCCFPHGVLPAGAFCNITTESSDFKQKYPEFQVKTSALRQLFFLPVTREIGLSIGGISCSAQSLSYILTKPEGGFIVNLFPGGAAEAFYAKPGQYKFVLKKRKGFIKIALKTGAPLVPVITFGDLELFDQVQFPIINKVQGFVKKCFGFVPVLILGRGFFQNSFGLIPRRKPLTTVVGMPINVTKTENPTQEQINELHEKFMQELNNLFQEYKYKCLKNPETTTLELV